MISKILYVPDEKDDKPGKECRLTLIPLLSEPTIGAWTMDEIFWIEKGKLAGRRYPSLEDLQYLFDNGFRLLVSFEERHDVREIESIGFEVHPIYVKDFTAPTIDQLLEFIDIVDSADEPILVHCIGGYGRTGTFLAAYLIARRGMEAGEAIEYVRDVRPGAIEVPEQILILEEFENGFKQGLSL